VARAKRLKPAVVLDPARDAIAEWRLLANGLGWPESDLDTITDVLVTLCPNTGGRPKVVYYVDRHRILTATPQMLHDGPAEERVPGTKDEWRERARTVLRWGVSTWHRSIEVPAATFYTQPEGTVWCQRHFGNCPHDDEGECARAKRERAEEAKVQLIPSACRCRRGWLGDHWQDCPEFRAYNETAARSLDAMFAGELPTAVEVAAPEPPAPEPARKREIDIKPKHKGKGVRVLAGQKSLI